MSRERASICRPFYRADADVDVKLLALIGALYFAMLLVDVLRIRENGR